LTLNSGWHVSFRNQFAQAADIASEIVRSAQHAPELITQEASDAEGDATNQLWTKIHSMRFDAVGPDYWR
jgi:hypothetical protein